MKTEQDTKVKRESIQKMQLIFMRHGAKYLLSFGEEG